MVISIINLIIDLCSDKYKRKKIYDIENPQLRSWLYPCETDVIFNFQHNEKNIKISSWIT